MRRVLGLTLVLILLIGYLPLSNIFVSGQVSVDVEVEVYKEILIRTLRVPNLDPEIRNRIEVLIERDITTPEDAMSFVREARAILDDVRRFVEVSVDVGIDVERSKLISIVDSYIELARDVNNMELVDKLSDALELLKEGNIEEARNILMECRGPIKEIRAMRSADAVERAVMMSLRHIPLNETAYEAIHMAMSNIDVTIEVLVDVLETLIEVNASEDAINAVNMAIEMLNRTNSILWSVSEVVKMAGMEGRVGNITVKVVVERLSDEVLDLREEIDGLYLEIEAIETELNVSLDDVRDVINNASILLDEAESALETGDYATAMRLVAHVRVLVEVADELLDEFEDEMESHAMMMGKMKRYVRDKYEDVMDEYIDLLGRFESLYNVSVEFNISLALDILVDTNKTLVDISISLEKVGELIDEGDYSGALELIREISIMVRSADEALDYVEDITGAVMETVGELYWELNDLKDILMSMEEMVGESLNGSLYDAAMEKISILWEAIDNASRCLMKGDFGKAGKLLRDIRVMVDGLREVVVEVIVIVDDVNDMMRVIDELRIMFSGIVEIQNSLDEAEMLLNNSITILVDALVEINIDILVDARDMVSVAHQIIVSIQEMVGNKYMVRFLVVDTDNRPVPMATILLDDKEYHGGEATMVGEGVYNLSVGTIPDGYRFVEWVVEGDATVENVSSPETTVSISGDATIILVLEKTAPSQAEYTITFYIRDVNGDIVANATIFFGGAEYGDGDSITVVSGNYSLAIGYIPEGYIFAGWRIEGQASIMNPNSGETIIYIYGDVSITLVLRKRGGWGSSSFGFADYV
jgi:hypothetical protein